ncbi:hypothetical protein WN48_04165, partial [Eufriesea mexicana]
IFILFLVTEVLGHFEDIIETDSFSNSNNRSIADSLVIFRAPSEAQHDESEVIAQVLIDGTRNDTNISHLKTSMESTNWNDFNQKLKFPTIDSEKQYKMANLHLERGIFIFDFLRKFLSFIQPYDVPVDLLTDAIENRLDTSKLISESLRLEAALLAVFGICCILCCVIPGIELWLACRPIKEDYQPSQHPGALTFFLAFFVCILGLGMVTMIVCNETVSASVAKFPIVVEAALQDLNDYHSSTTIQLRKCLSRSLDVASEAILADLDNIEELLGKPIQTELSTETGLDIAISTLTDLINATQKVSSNVESLLNDGENIRKSGKVLTIEVDSLRRNLENTLKACTGQDRPLCTIIDSSGLRVTLWMDQFLRDSRLILLRDSKRSNLTETIRQARGEYLYIPQHIARNSLEVRNQEIKLSYLYFIHRVFPRLFEEIRREVNRMRARIFDETRNMEASNSELVKQLEFARRLVDNATPYIIVFEHVRWLIGIVFIMTLMLSSHTEMLICRPLQDSNYSAIEAILETRIFLGKRLNIPLKDLLKKCRENEPAYPAFGLGNTMKLEQLTAYWTWSSFTRIILKFKFELKTLKIFTPYLRQQLHNLLYACGLNLTEHRVMNEYLGISVKQGLRFKLQVQEMAHKRRKVINRVTKLTKTNWSLRHRALSTLYKGIINHLARTVTDHGKRMKNQNDTTRMWRERDRMASHSRVPNIECKKENAEEWTRWSRTRIANKSYEADIRGLVPSFSKVCTQRSHSQVEEITRQTGSKNRAKRITRWEKKNAEEEKEIGKEKLERRRSARLANERPTSNGRNRC